MYERTLSNFEQLQQTKNSDETKNQALKSEIDAFKNEDEKRKITSTYVKHLEAQT